MNTIGQISEINFEIGEIFISEWTLSLKSMDGSKGIPLLSEVKRQPIKIPKSLSFGID